MRPDEISLASGGGEACGWYLNAGVGAGQLGELDAAAVIHVPQAHLPGNMKTHQNLQSHASWLHIHRSSSV